MRKKWKRILLFVMMVQICGCGKKEQETTESEMAMGDYLQALQTAEETIGEAVEENAIDYVHIGSGTGQTINLIGKDGAPQGYKDEVYTGEAFEFEVYYDINQPDEAVEYSNYIFVLMIDGVPQPFCWDGEEVMYVSIPMESEMEDESRISTLRFQPAYVPYGDTVCMTLLQIAQPQTHFDFAHTFAMAGGLGWQFRITAATPDVAIDREMCQLDLNIPEYDAKSDFQGTANWRFTSDISVAEKMEMLDQLEVNTAFVSDQQLYAVCQADQYTEENTKMYVYAWMDGKPLAAFDGKWYCTFTVDPLNVYEIPLDMSQIPPGDHLIWFSANSNVMEKQEFMLSFPAYMYDVVVE
ncbi:MAG: hypothetical protein IJV50_00550 [Lachnospiraceae bacterium]|nr:hypothetical protein [Lachnospiraceae bacterium]